MADAYKVLYQGQLGSSVATLATVGASKSWIVKMITAVNTASGSRTFGLYVNGTGAANQVTSSSITLSANGTGFVWDGMSMTLAAGDTIAGGADAASKVTVTIFGDEVS